MAFTSRFVFIGNVGISKDQDKFYNTFLNAKKTWQSSRINFLVKESDNNGVFVELFGGHQVDGKGEVFSMDTDRNKITIPWSDRNDPETLKMVADYKKFRVNLDEQKEFITEYDMVEYLKGVLPNVTNPVVVTGQIKKEEYKGKFNNRFVLQTIRYAKEDEKNKLSASMDVYYSRDSLDDSDFKENKVLKLAGYVSQYIDKDTGVKYLPQEFVLSAKKLDFTNEKHKAKFDLLKKYLTVKGKTYVHIPWQVSIFRGADEVQWDETMLTKSQKEQIEFGLATVDDFKPKNNPLGGNVFEYRLVKPLLVGDFTDGVQDTELKIEEFEEHIYVPVAKTEKFEEPKENKTVDVDNIVDSDDEDLFS